jgi:hypothetical protein
MLRPVPSLPGDLFPKEQPGDVTGVGRRMEQKVHAQVFTTGLESEAGQQHHRLAAFLMEFRSAAQGLDRLEFLIRIH